MNKQMILIRRWIIFFMITLFISGLTAMPAETELQFLSRCFPPDTKIGDLVEKIYIGVANTNRDYPFMAYGYDWLAFAHFVLAILFIGPYRDPVKNKWVIEFGMIACVLIIPFALIAGSVRGIPFWWRMIDCSFGLIGLLPLNICYSNIRQLEKITAKEMVYEN
ncbi:MAG TPA: hypothetical protein VI461_08845 [Chitinophagaceae bacterium]|nr:hypothetical protein [Chitinophagaceae bacterium]